MKLLEASRICDSEKYKNVGLLAINITIANSPLAPDMDTRKDLKNIFLTYPQCPVPPCALLDFLKDLLGDNLDCCCISQELHADGNTHLHAFVQLKEKIRLNKDKFSYFFDLNYDDPCYHPNTQAARNVKNVVQYVVKGRFNGAMQDFIEYNMSCEALLKKKAPKSDTIAKLLVSGKSVKEAFDQEPGYVGFNLDKVQKLHAWLKEVNQPQVPLQQWQLLDLAQYELNSPAFEIALWLNTNIHARRPARTRHLMIIGPKRMGKSYLVRSLKNFLKVYICPVKGPYYSPWEDGKYGLIHMEELHAGWQCSDLLHFLDGSEILLKVHGSFNRKTDNVPIIITTNQDFRTSYKNISDTLIEALEDRVTVVRITDPLDVFPGLVPIFDT